MPTSIEFLELVEQMTRIGIPQEKAEAEARRELGMLAPLEQLRSEADRDALEDEITLRGDALVRALGFDVVRISQKRASKITPGVSDRYYVHRRRRLAVWVEYKSATGRQRPEQREFQIMCEEAGLHYVLGGMGELRAWLTAVGVARFDAHGIPEPVREPSPE